MRRLSILFFMRPFYFFSRNAAWALSSTSIASRARRNRPISQPFVSRSITRFMASTPSPITSVSATQKEQPPLKVNLLTIPQLEFEELLQSWSFPKYRAKQILDWVQKGITNYEDMNNIPKKLRNVLMDRTTIGTLDLEVELNSKDGTKKRAYRLWDGQLIESVLMP